MRPAPRRSRRLARRLPARVAGRLDWTASTAGCTMGWVAPPTTSVTSPRRSPPACAPGQRTTTARSWHRPGRRHAPAIVVGVSATQLRRHDDRLRNSRLAWAGRGLRLVPGPTRCRAGRVRAQERLGRIFTRMVVPEGAITTALSAGSRHRLADVSWRAAVSGLDTPVDRTARHRRARLSAPTLGSSAGSRDRGPRAGA